MKPNAAPSPTTPGGAFEFKITRARGWPERPSIRGEVRCIDLGEVEPLGAAST